MFDDLDVSLRQLIADAAAPQVLREADVSFETPGRDYSPGRPTLNLFLHQVQEDRVRRDPVPVIDRTGPQLVRRDPPLRVECFYLVTAWSDLTAGSAVRVAHEHRLLGVALAWLARFGSLPPASLYGSLVGQPVPAPTVVARPQAPAQPGQFWTALGVLPRPAFELAVTVALDLGTGAALGRPVASAEFRITQHLAPSPEPAPAARSARPARPAKPAKAAKAAKAAPRSRRTGTGK